MGPTIRNIQSLIGVFDLDPNRVLDLTLEVCIIHVSYCVRVSYVCVCLWVFLRLYGCVN